MSDPVTVAREAADEAMRERQEAEWKRYVALLDVEAASARFSCSSGRDAACVSDGLREKWRAAQVHWTACDKDVKDAQEAQLKASLAFVRALKHAESMREPERTTTPPAKRP